MHTHTRVPSLASVAENHASGSNNVKSALDQITNTPSDILQSPQLGEGRIFKPLAVTSPSAIPTAIRTNPTFTTASPMPTSDMVMKPPVPLAPKPKLLPGRKPRISRSKVIARLASQRAASHSSTSIASGSSLVPGAMSPPAGPSGGRVRSSLGAKRESYGGVKARKGSATGDVLMSAKKRARQSEYARRRSRVAGPSLGLAVGANAMDVDE